MNEDTVLDTESLSTMKNISCPKLCGILTADGRIGPLERSYFSEVLNWIEPEKWRKYVGSMAKVLC